MIKTTDLTLCLSALFVVFTAVTPRQPNSEESIELASNAAGLSVPFKIEKSTPPVVEYMVDQVNKSNQLQSLLGLRDNVSNRNCEQCNKSEKSIRYMTCNSNNDYLEKSLNKLENSNKDSILADMVRNPLSETPIIKHSCLRISMESRFGIGSKSFRECSGNSMSRAFRPCISENYFKLIANSFDLVSSCMMKQMAPKNLESQLLNVESVFSLITVESGFHVNARSGTGASGIGQFTSAAIEDINKNELSEIRNELEKDSRCSVLADEMLSSKAPMSASKARSCERMSLENGNPIKNMIYTYAYMKRVSKALDKALFMNSKYYRKFDLTAADYNKLRRALMVTAHNAGPAGALTPAKALLNTTYRNRPVTNADQFIKQLEKAMSVFPASANKSAARRKETSQYFPSITKTLDKISTNVGGGSCVNF